MKTYEKDPDTTRIYTVDWSGELATSDTISTSTWTIPTGITSSANAKANTSTTVTVSGGTAGETYVLTNRVVTVGGQTQELSIALVVRQTIDESGVLARVQANPEITTANPEYVADLVQQAKRFIVGYCKLPRFPERAQGYSRGGVAPSTNLSALTSNEILVSVNGSSFMDINPVLASCTTGDATATELQRVIRAESELYGFDEVTVTYNDDHSTAAYYEIKSGRYGELSTVNVLWNEARKHVAQAMKLSPTFGGEEVAGSEACLALEDAAVQLVEQAYRKLGLEGMKEGEVPWGVSFVAHDLDPRTRSVLNAHRRLW